jgi:hypothetical protein
MGIGDANKLAVYIAKHANATVDIDKLAADAIDKVIISKPDGIVTIEKVD